MPTQSDYLFSPMDDKFEPSVPPLSVIVNITPKAHLETKFYNGMATTDPVKRAYMIELANVLREWNGWFKGVKRIHMDLVLVFDRPNEKPDGYTRAEWNDPNLELKKITAPDLDNCEKSIQDCLSNHKIQKENRSKKTWNILAPEIRGAGIIDDDQYIVTKKVSKIYHRIGEGPRIEFTLSEVSRYFVRNK